MLVGELSIWARQMSRMSGLLVCSSTSRARIAYLWTATMFGSLIPSNMSQTDDYDEQGETQ